VLWLIPALLTVHNAEEAFAFERSWPRLPALLPEPFATLAARLPFALMLQTLIGLSLLAFLLAAVVVARPDSRRAVWLLLALEAAVAINVAAHLITAIVVFGGYSPGLGTALLLNAPFAWYVFRRARYERWVSPRAWRASFLGGLALHGPVLLGLLWVLGAATRVVMTKSIHSPG
jgi:hypothetical protein